MAVVRLQDVIVPTVFAPYRLNRTTELTAVLTSGALVPSAWLADFLAGPGLMINVPFYKDLEAVEENTSSDDPDVKSVPNKIGTGSEIAVRCSRNNSWSSMDLVNTLTGTDPMAVIADLVAGYWARRFQRLLMSTAAGVFANNATATDAYHTQNDLTYDVSGTAYAAGITNFTAENYIDTTALLGDAKMGLGLTLMHSVVYARLQKNNLIDFIPDARGEVRIPTYQGAVVVVDDMMPRPSPGVFDTYIMGAGAFQWAMGNPPVPTETGRSADAGNGGGQDILYDRVEFAIHPTGHAFTGNVAAGGPTNAQLATAGNWRRAVPERKQVRIIRLRTREF